MGSYHLNSLYYSVLLVGSTSTICYVCSNTNKTFIKSSSFAIFVFFLELGGLVLSLVLNLLRILKLGGLQASLYSS